MGFKGFESPNGFKRFKWFKEFKWLKVVLCQKSEIEI